MNTTGADGECRVLHVVHCHLLEDGLQFVADTIRENDAKLAIIDPIVAFWAETSISSARMKFVPSWLHSLQSRARLRQPS